MSKDKHTSVYFDRDAMRFVGLQEVHLNQLRSAYKGLNIDAELNKMALWLMSSAGAKRQGTIGFILHWLNRAAPLTVTEQLDFYEQNSPLRPLLTEYLGELWKGREHILEFNKIRKS